MGHLSQLKAVLEAKEKARQEAVDRANEMIDRVNMALDFINCAPVPADEAPDEIAKILRGEIKFPKTVEAREMQPKKE